jgi:hypothetical protein
VVEALSREHGFTFLDLKPHFVDASKRLFEGSHELLWWRDDSHWNPRGHAAAADVTYAHVLAKLSTR